jgi:uncharacterized protein (DUF1800 family)
MTRTLLPTTLRAKVLIGAFAIFTLAPQFQLAAQKAAPKADAKKVASAVPANPDAQTILHVLNRLGYGPKPGDISRVRAMGLAAYIDQQLNPEKIADPKVDAALAQFPTLTMSTEELSKKYFAPLEAMRRDAQLKQARAAIKEGKSANDPAMVAQAQAQLTPEGQALRQEGQQVLQALMQSRLIRAVDSEKQLNEVLVDFWFNHFNVYAQKGAVHDYLNEYDRDIIRPYVLGNFRDMLGAVAHSPAMLFYLDNFQSVDPKAAERQMAAQNLRRGRANQRRPGAPMPQNMERLEQQQQRMPRGLNENYARELMELHTLGVDGGYTQKDVQEVARVFTGWTIDQPRSGGSFEFRAQTHDMDEKIVLGKSFGKKETGEAEGERVLDMLAMHPSTARHISFKLAQRFVSDTPPDSLVDRAAARFLETKGDLREVMRTIITSPEFFTDEAYRAKVKTPLDFVASAVRATGASINNAQPLVQALRNLGMPLFGCQPPTGYSTTSDAWVNTGALLNRMNFALGLVSNQQRGVRVNLQALAPGTDEETRDKLLRETLASQVSSSTQATLAKATSQPQLLALLFGSPEFQKR